MQPSQGQSSTHSETDSNASAGGPHLFAAGQAWARHLNPNTRPTLCRREETLWCHTSNRLPLLILRDDCPRNDTVRSGIALRIIGVEEHGPSAMTPNQRSVRWHVMSR